MFSENEKILVQQLVIALKASEEQAELDYNQPHNLMVMDIHRRHTYLSVLNDAVGLMAFYEGLESNINETSKGGIIKQMDALSNELNEVLRTALNQREKGGTVIALSVGKESPTKVVMNFFEAPKHISPDNKFLH